MTVVAQSVLETASFVDLEPELVGQQTDQAEAVVMTHLVRPDRPQRELIRLRWQSTSAAIADAVRNHHASNVGAFPFQMRSGDTFDVVYAEPPSFQPRSSNSVDITVVLERAFDSD